MASMPFQIQGLVKHLIDSLKEGMSYAYTNSSNARYSMTSRLYSPQNDPDAWVYQHKKS